MSTSLSDNDLGIKLKQLCKDYRLTQATLAKSLGLKNQQLASDLMNGNKHFTSEIILKICKLFEVSILQFIGSSNHRSFPENFVNDAEHQILINTNDPELKLLIYKKWFIEAQIIIAENKLNLIRRNGNNLNLLPSKHHIYVLI